FFIKHIRPTDVFYDIGANYGFYSLLALQLVPAGEVHVFEPLPDVFERIKQNFPADKRLFLNRAALSDRSGEVDFFSGSESGSSGTSTMNSDFVADDASAYRKIR